ncbi:MAG: glucosidase [Bacteroidota bacterium]
MQEQKRLDAYYANPQKGDDWLFWGPYLSERQWGTVREDYSANGDAWNYFPHDHARSRAYRWGEDGLLGITDRFCRLCFAPTLWNGNDPILKERLFGLTGPEGNHGEDVKELYYYLDNTPTHSYMKALYKYPQAAFPYDEIVETNSNRSRHEREYELLDTGVFDENRYFDLEIEYAKADADDLLIKLTVHNRGPEAAPVWLLPTLWFRNRWSFRPEKPKPKISFKADGELLANRHRIGSFHFYYDSAERCLFTENETNRVRVFGEKKNKSPFVKDAFHKAVIEDDYAFLEEKKTGTKAAPLYHWTLAAGEAKTVRLRLSKKAHKDPLGKSFDKAFAARLKEADEFYDQIHPKSLSPEQRNIQRQALAGMLWTKQYYHIDVPQWLEGDPNQPPPPAERKKGRNRNWMYLNNQDILSMPDKWEYPWYAAWDLAFHCVPLAMVDINFAKEQLILMLREWYMAPNGQIPAYEWNFSDVNPPVHAWAALKIYEMEKERNGQGDINFLKRVFQKLSINFTWWVNRKDINGNNVFEGGFLGLDNIGVFDRSNELPGGGHLEQADGTSWVAAYSLQLMQMALEISLVDPSFEDITTKFFEHFVYIAETLNHIGEDWTPLWHEEDGFYYDVLQLPGDRYEQIRVRSLVGLTPLFATTVIRKEIQDKLPEFCERLEWFHNYWLADKDYSVLSRREQGNDILLAMVKQERLEALLKAMLDEAEFLSEGGIRSLSRYHAENPYALEIEGHNYGIGYVAGESTTGMFGGNSNWRGPIWFPMNYMLIEALRTMDQYYGSDYKVEYPSGSGEFRCLSQIADGLAERLISIFEPNEQGHRPAHDGDLRYAKDPHFKDLILFYEYFHGDDLHGLGASHQTGWTGLVANLLGWKSPKEK